ITNRMDNAAVAQTIWAQNLASQIRRLSTAGGRLIVTSGSMLTTTSADELAHLLSGGDDFEQLVVLAEAKVSLFRDLLLHGIPQADDPLPVGADLDPAVFRLNEALAGRNVPVIVGLTPLFTLTTAGSDEVLSGIHG